MNMYLFLFPRRVHPPTPSNYVHDVIAITVFVKKDIFRAFVMAMQ